MRIFLSHSSADHALAEEICSELERNGHCCFIAPRDIRSGYEYAEELVNGIDSCEIMLLLLSKQANESPHVLREIERAVSKSKTIIVYKLEDVALSKSMEYYLMTHQWLDMKPGRNHHEVIRVINQYSAEHSGIPAVTPAEKETAGKQKYITIFAAVLILAAAAVAVSLNLHSGTAPEAEKTSETVKSTDPALNVTSQISTPDETAEAKPESIQATTAGSTSAATLAEIPQVTTSSASSEPVSQTSSQTEPEPELTEPVQTAAPIDPQTSTAEEPIPSQVEVKEGSSLFLGKYNGSPIEWRVIHISDDGKSAVVISDRILTMKAFDAAEGGEYNFSDGENYWRTPTDDISPDLQRSIRGDNRWEFSNIRTWLNSNKEMVRYTDQPPVSTAMSEHDNGYNTEPGFLKNFTDEELAVIEETRLSTGDSATSDRIFLLSSDEIQWLYDSDVSIYAQPTPEAIEQDTANWYDIALEAYGTTEHFWWLRDADSSNSCKADIVNISLADSVISTQYVGLEGYGIRPAMTIDLTAAALPGIMENSNGTN